MVTHIEEASQSNKSDIMNSCGFNEDLNTAGIFKVTEKEAQNLELLLIQMVFK